MRWFLLFFLVAGCGAAPVASVPTSTSTSATPTVTTTHPRIDTPRKLAGFDPCALLEAKDFDEPLNTPPAPHPNVPNSCTYRVGAGTDADLIVIAALAGPYEGKKSSEVLVDGHSMAASCNAGVECTMQVAVSAAESVNIIVHLKGANEEHRVQIGLGKAKAALRRLPK